MKKQLNDHITEIARLYFEEFRPLREIGGLYSASGMAIRNCLARHGHDTSKRRYDAACTRCGVVVKRTRKVIRTRTQNIGVFCSMKCYHARLREMRIFNPGRHPRTSQRDARALVAAVYGSLPPESIVHHINGIEEDNRLENLMLLDSQASHLMLHRGFGSPVILWDGREYMRGLVQIPPARPAP